MVLLWFFSLPKINDRLFRQGEACSALLTAMCGKRCALVGFVHRQKETLRKNAMNDIVGDGNITLTNSASES